MPQRSISERQIQTARYAKALGHPVRVAILEMLAEQSCCYHGDMSEVLPVAKSTLSQHLNCLKKAGLIQGEIEPPMTKYCLNRDNWKAAQTLLSNLLKSKSI